ncbi:MAG: DUF554 domain-containing protein [Coriobacteriales bacterium]|nr:DUF554 domain-containing protein [Coriobacteriales bacterium]
MSGVLLNIVTVILGTAIGTTLGRHIPERFRQIAFFAIGSATIAFGAIMAVNGFNELAASKVGSLAALVLVASLIAGALIGELLRIEQRLESLGGRLQMLLRRTAKQKPRVAHHGSTGKPQTPTTPTIPAEQGGGESSPAQQTAAPSTFANGFMTASIFFCVGAMTVMGSIQAGLGDPSTLYLKSMLDGISAIALSTALGIGVGFSALAVLVIQGGIALLSSVAGGFFTPAILASISAVGGAMLIALGIDILGIKKLRVGNMLPALLCAILLGYLLG